MAAPHGKSIKNVLILNMSIGPLDHIASHKHKDMFVSTNSLFRIIWSLRGPHTLTPLPIGYNNLGWSPPRTHKCMRSRSPRPRYPCTVRTKRGPRTPMRT